MKLLHSLSVHNEAHSQWNKWTPCQPTLNPKQWHKLYISYFHRYKKHQWPTVDTVNEPLANQQLIPMDESTCMYLIFLSTRSTSPDKCLHHLSMTTLSSQLEWCGLSYTVSSWYHTLPVKLHQLFNHTYGTLHSCNVCARVSILKHSNVSIPPMKNPNIVAYRS